jgi:hypothetical protein
MLKVLPLQSGRIMAAIPLSKVLRVQHLEVKAVSDAQAEAALPEPRPSGIKAIALSDLLGDVVAATSNKHAIIIAAPAGTFGLLVETVGLPQNAENIQPLSWLLGAARQIFSGVIMQESSFVLLLDIDSIARYVLHAEPAASPEAAHVLG